MPTSSTATPGTPTWAACSRASCGTSRSCSASTRSSRSGPWKVEQLGNGYHLSSWMERTAIEQADAIIAVSEQTREDVLRLFDVAAGAGPRDPQRHRSRRVPADRRDRRARAPRHRSGPALRPVRRPDHAPEGHHPPGRRDPARSIPACRSCSAPARPTRPRSAARWRRGSPRSAPGAPGVIWIREMLPRAEVIQLYEHAAVFCCPSVYEPFGIINLEAMACETAVVASRGRRHPGGGGARGDRPAGRPDAAAPAPSSRPTRRPSPPALAAAINRLGARPRAARAGWASRAASGCSSTSAGTRSPRPRSTSTARCDEDRSMHAP